MGRSTRLEARQVNLGVLGKESALKVFVRLRRVSRPREILIGRGLSQEVPYALELHPSHNACYRLYSIWRE